MGSRRSILCALLAVVFLAVGAGAAGAGHHEGDETPEAMEKALWESWANQDVEAFGRLLADDFVSVVPAGITAGKEANLATIGYCEVAGYQLGEMTRSQTAEGVVTLTYEATQDATCAGERLPRQIYASSIWVKGDGGWRSTLYHETAAATVDPTRVDPDHYKVVFENDEVRVLRITYGPGEKSVMHYHPRSVAVMLDANRVKMTLPDGTSSVMEPEAGATMWAPAGSHQPENLGDNSFQVIQIELKGD